MNHTDRYNDTDPLIPEWAAPVYLWMGAITAAGYLLLAIVMGASTGMAVVKTLSVVLLAGYAGFSKAPLLAMALLLSAAGDYALGITPPAREAGIAFFAAAHIGYIAIFTLIILKSGFKRDGLILAIGLVVFGAAMYGWLSPGMGPMRAPVTAYLIIILAMAVLAGFAKGPRLLAIGAVLFVVSDCLIAAGWFRGVSVTYGRLDLIAAAIWILYFAAQVCLALGVIRYKRALVTKTPEEDA